VSELPSLIQSILFDSVPIQNHRLNKKTAAPKKTFFHTKMTTIIFYMCGKTMQGVAKNFYAMKSKWVNLLA
jgi:hypothetical protein